MDVSTVLRTTAALRPGRVRNLVTDAAAVARARWHLRRAEELGSRVRVWGRLQIMNQGSLIVHPRVQLVSNVATTELAIGKGARLEIGERAFINYGCSIAAMQEVEIGPRCSIGTYVMIMDNDFHRLEPERRDEMPDSSPIRLGENVWVGGRSIILNGVSIGDHSVIGAGSVVNCDIPPRSVAAGVPAKVLRTL